VDLDLQVNNKIKKYKKMSKYSYYTIPDYMEILQQDEVNIYEEDFVKLVQEECKLIPQHFTSEEIDKVFNSEINGESSSECVYGTMVGDCNNKKVSDFIINNLSTITVANDSATFDNKIFLPEDRTFVSIMTPVELYITPRESEIYEDLEDESNEYANSYYDRIKDVVKWIKDEVNI